jgi:hypothetical protein
LLRYIIVILHGIYICVWLQLTSNLAIIGCSEKKAPSIIWTKKLTGASISNKNK